MLERVRRVTTRKDAINENKAHTKILKDTVSPPISNENGKLYEISIPSAGPVYITASLKSEIPCEQSRKTIKSSHINARFDVNLLNPIK